MQLTKTFIISGAGSGIGRVAAQMLAENEHNNIVLVGRTEEKLIRTKELLKNPQQHYVVAAKVQDGVALKRAFAELNLTNVCGAVANAGIADQNDYGEHDNWANIIETNLTGTYVFVNETLPYLKNSDCEFKNIIVISSILAHLGVPSCSAYCASKAALLGLVHSWAIEWSQFKILVNTISPGWVETEMALARFEDLAQMTKRSVDDVIASQVALVPLKKMSKPEEVASLIAFLLSDGQNSITGEEIQINNGAYMA